MKQESETLEIPARLNGRRRPLDDVQASRDIRGVAIDRVRWFSVSSENFESIHNHNAYAQIQRDKHGLGLA